ncbi:MAG: sugar phosphate isomerase/epimerase family protein [Terriglobia bacterium]
MSRTISRRSFLALSAAAPLAIGAPRRRQVPVGLELYSVRNALRADLPGTLRSVAGMGYTGVEFFAPYYQWTADQAKQVRKQLEELHLWCHSTHNNLASFRPPGIAKAIELNGILGTRYVVLADPGRVTGMAGWKGIAETLDSANRTLERHGLHAGYHNHAAEWVAVEGARPMDILAANTDRSIMLQLDVGTCVAAGADPVAWIRKNPGRIRSLHLKDWSRQQGYRVLFGEGASPWKRIFAAAESVGGVEYYLIEQEGSAYPEIKTAQLCLENYRKLRAPRRS